MAKQFKLKIKNVQLAQAAGIGKEEKVKTPAIESPTKENSSKAKSKDKEKAPTKEAGKEANKEANRSSPLPEEAAPRRIRAKSKSSFTPTGAEEIEEIAEELPPLVIEEEVEEQLAEVPISEESPPAESAIE